MFSKFLCHSFRHSQRVNLVNIICLNSHYLFASNPDLSSTIESNDASPILSLSSSSSSSPTVPEKKKRSYSGKVAEKVIPKSPRAKLNGFYITKDEVRMLKLNPDPKAISPPSSGYALYVKQWYIQYNNEENKLKGENASTLMKKIGQEWTSLDKESQQVWNTIVSKAKDKYKEKMSKYDNEKENYEWLQLMRPHIEKRPSQNGYSSFYTDNYHVIKNQKPDLKMKDIAKEVGQEWHKLNEDEKNEYHERAAIQYNEWKKEFEEIKEKRARS